MKIAMLVLIVLSSIFISVIYYFFSLDLSVVNQSKYRLDRVDCKSNNGKNWIFNNIFSGGSQRKLLWVNHGSAIQCKFSVQGNVSDLNVVVGYFDENKGSISLVIKEESGVWVMNINESIGNKIKRNEKVTILFQ
ncbi:hypothetical protein [Iodobacter fluviatilis]|uniref:Uncharacterized protein n=1 Tax=Iodobacter fluviatilis TaxID=537 RepID=A0A377Q2K2_9NEIS|nr:hypothetical protein [Iodobacter fluviatilis]TCU90469.1 hypothetical protein EV682_101502 [Iodobacter fluviatilis]STQ89496.1 Uncharacterised protein [Iodobacter fluviatilis]